MYMMIAYLPTGSALACAAFYVRHRRHLLVHPGAPAHQRIYIRALQVQGFPAQAGRRRWRLQVSKH